MPLRTFPGSLAREQSVLWELTGTTISGGQTASGIMPVTRIDGGGLWKATLADVFLKTADQVRTWRALAAYCEGGAQPIIVPMCDKRFFPGTFTNPVVPHSDDSPHSDDAPYDGSIVAAMVFGSYPLRATTIIMNLSEGTELRGGEHFSINHPVAGWRLYRVIGVDGDEVSFRPPLRELVDDGTDIEFDHPRCIMRLATFDAMDLTLHMRKYGNPTVNFIEAFPPFPPEL